MPDLDAMRESLIKRAETILRPSLAILLECAFEAERNENAAIYLEGIAKRFYICAENGIPLNDDKYEVFDMFLPAPTGDADLFAVGLLSEETKSLESVFRCGIAAGTAEFIKYVSEQIIALGLSKLTPILLGIGISGDEHEAKLLARKAMFRSPDSRSSDHQIAECEKRLLLAINRDGPGAGGYGGDHTAIAVSIEQTGTGFVALCPGDYFTRFASKKL